jgi:hypothetical protein
MTASGHGAPFGRVIALHDPSLEAVLWALTAALGGASAARLHAHVSLLAQRLDGLGGDPALQLDALSDRVASGFTVPRRSTPDLEDLLPDRVLAGAPGDALTVAAIVAMAGQRRGWDVEVVAGARSAFVAHRGLDFPLVCSPAHDGRLIDARDAQDGEDLWRCCAHDVADRLLMRMADRAQGIARHDLAARALELASLLPGDRQAAARRRVALARARSAFN